VRFKCAFSYLIVIAVEMRHRAFISLPESLAVVVPEVARHMRMTELLTVLDVRLAVVLEVLPRSFNPVMKPLSLCFTELRGRRIPAAIPVVVILNCGS